MKNECLLNRKGNNNTIQQKTNFITQTNNFHLKILIISGEETSYCALNETYTRKSLVKGERFIRFVFVSATRLTFIIHLHYYSPLYLLLWVVRYADFSLKIKVGTVFICQQNVRSDHSPNVIEKYLFQWIFNCRYY